MSVKRLLAVAAIVSALGPTTAAAEDPFDWTGFYIGTHNGGGGGWAGWDATNLYGDPIPDDFGGFPAMGLLQGVLGGGQVGFALQRGRLVMGVEAAISASNIDGQIDCDDGGDIYVAGFICNTRLNALATLTGQLGLAVGRTQFYVAGGLAWGSHTHEVREPGYAYALVCPPCISYGIATEMSLGWTAGFGVERAMSHGWSFRTDYRYVSFPSRDIVLADPFWPDGDATVDQSYFLVSFGLNYRFGDSDTPGLTYPDNHRGWVREFGQRAWLTFSDYRFDLYGASFDPSDQVSRLTYGTSIGGVGEGFFRTESPAGFFLSSVAGAGVTSGGLLVDEDFPPLTTPYSRTESTLSGGRFRYTIMDVGWTFRGPRGSIGLFTGATAILERYQAYGCEQTELNLLICAPSVPSDYEVISQTTGWAGLRVGVAAEANLSDRVSVRGEGAYLPLVYMAGYDNHWHRPDINPLLVYGRATGFQVEGSISIAASDNLTIGFGGRYWHMAAIGGALFPPYVSEQPQETASRHYGAFFEVNYVMGQ